MALVQLLINVVIIGVALWAINRYIPMTATVQKVVNGVAILVAVLFVFSGFGLLG